MRGIYFFICFLSPYLGTAQDLSGTWEGVFYSDRMGKRNEFSIRIFLEQEDDFVWGICEATSVEKSRVRSLSDFDYNEYRCRYPVSGIVPTVLQKNSPVFISTQRPPAFFMAPLFCETISSFYLAYDVVDSIAQLSGEWVSVSGVNAKTISEANNVFIQRLSGKTPGFIEEFHPGRQKKIKIIDADEKSESYKKEVKNKFTMFKKKTKKDSKESTEKDSLLTGNENGKAIEKTRLQDVQQYLELDSGLVQISIYDNGVVDGDIASIFFNSKKLGDKVKLSGKPLQFELLLEAGTENEFRLYAENVGQIPPNTAVMLIQAGSKRYEVNLSASFQSDAIVILKIKK